MCPCGRRAAQTASSAGCADGGCRTGRRRRRSARAAVMRGPRHAAPWLLPGVASIVACAACTPLVDAPAAPITVTRVRFGPIEWWVTTNRVVEPRDPHVIRAPVTAFVKEVNVVEGQ